MAPERRRSAATVLPPLLLVISMSWCCGGAFLGRRAGLREVVVRGDGVPGAVRRDAGAVRGGGRVQPGALVVGGADGDAGRRVGGDGHGEGDGGCGPPGGRGRRGRAGLPTA